ncbi:hypothetical protein DLREEDagrD3_20550 [Denitratisoma sp. agr-D3]
MNREERRPLVKRRRLRLAAADAATLAEACHRIGEVPGVLSVAAAGDGLWVSYDLLRTDLVRIEAAAGVAWRAGLHGLRRGLWKFTEQNERDNALRAGDRPCCSRPPPRRR